jgi:hypothetical protein
MGFAFVRALMYDVGTEGAVVFIYLLLYPFVKQGLPVTGGEARALRVGALRVGPVGAVVNLIYLLVQRGFWPHAPPADPLDVVFGTLVCGLLAVGYQLMLNQIFLVRFRSTNWCEGSADTTAVLLAGMLVYALDFQVRQQAGAWAGFEYPLVLIAVALGTQLIAFKTFADVFKHEYAFNVERQRRIHAHLAQKWQNYQHRWGKQWD